MTPYWRTGGAVSPFWGLDRSRAPKPIIVGEPSHAIHGALEDVARDEGEIERALGAVEGLPTPA
jgi:hypothetical protein